MIAEWMQKRGKALKPDTKVKEKKSKLTAAKRNELIDALLEKFGYIEDDTK